MKKLALAAFIVLAFIQWIIPAGMIYKKERILDQGVSLKFESAPVDPNHPFFGKYVHLDFKDDYYKFQVRGNYQYGEKIFVSFDKDETGFARITGISKKKPETKSYLQTEVSAIQTVKDTTTVFFELPFNRFYMEEYKAPRAETIYRERGLDTGNRTYAVVSVLNGDAVIKDVFVNDTSIIQLLERNDGGR